MKKRSEKPSSANGVSTETKGTRRQIQAKETKNKIYHAAIKKINEKGFKNVSIEDITAEANVAKGTFYTHFESKEAVVFYTYKNSDEVYKQAYEQVKHLDFFPMVTQFARISYIEYEKRGKGIIQAMITNYFAKPEYNVYGKDRALLQCLALIVESGKDEQVLDKAVATDTYVNILLSTLVGVEVLWCFETQGLSLADMIDVAVRVTAKGMMLSD